MPDPSPDVERELAAVDDALAGRRVDPELAELAELALLLRDDRPAPPPGFGPRLDARVERGFPRRGPRRPASRRRWTEWLAPSLAASAAAAAVAVAVVSLPGANDEQTAGGGRPTTAMTEEGGRGDSGARDAAAESAGSGGIEAQAPAGADGSRESFAAPEPVPPAPGAGSPGSDGRDRRKVERTASITLAARPRDIDAVSARVQEVTRRQGGFVLSSTVSSSPGGGGGAFELRIPTENLDAAMAALSRLGDVRERAQGAQDITAEAVSARDRLQDARTERTSLLRQLAGADTPQETASIRARLRVVSAEIARARAGVRRVGNRASFATVTLTLLAERGAGAGTTGGPGDDGVWTPGDALRDAQRLLEVAAGVALIALAAGVPLALLAALAAAMARWTARRRRERALDPV